MLEYGNESLPLYVQIKRIIKEQIESEKLRYGDIIPSEAEYQKMYEVSRTTVRQAILDLERDGYVKRARGKGTSVIYQRKIQEQLSHISSFTQEMKDKNIIPGTLFCETSYVKADEDIAEVFGIPINEEVFCIKRVRTGDDKPIVYFVTYVSKDRNLPMEASVYKGPLYDVLSSVGLDKPSKINEEFSAISASKSIAEKLEMKTGSAVLLRVRKSYDMYGNILEYTLSYYRGDRYTYSVTVNE